MKGERQRGRKEERKKQRRGGMKKGRKGERERSVLSFFEFLVFTLVCNRHVHWHFPFFKSPELWIGRQDEPPGWVNFCHY